MGSRRYCGEKDAGAINMAIIILNQPGQRKCIGYFNFREHILDKELKKYDNRMAGLTSKLNRCSIQ